MGRGVAAARQDERAQRGKLRIEPIDFGLEPSHLFIGDGQPRSAGPLTLPRRAKVGADIEEIVLDPRQRGMKRGIAGRVQPRDAYRGIGFVHRAIGGDPQIVFLTPPAGAERGRAVVAGARVDFVQNDHRALRSYFAISQTVNMITTMAMNCSKTRNRINCCDRCGEPPRIILTRPSNNTTATAPIAIGTPIWDMKLAMQVYVAGLERERKADRCLSGLPRSGKSGIHNHGSWIWIPGFSWSLSSGRATSRGPVARPGMTLAKTCVKT